MDGMAAAAEKETAAAQARLTDSVVEEARNLASKIQFGKTGADVALFCPICPAGLRSLMLWAGFRIDTGRTFLWRRFAYALRLALSAGCVS